MNPPERPVRVKVTSHSYQEWSYTYPDHKTDLPNSHEMPSPLSHKWFHHDLVDLRNPKNPILLHSPTTTAKHIPGILVIDSNRTYGRTANKKRLLYKCIPDDKHLPHFLVPYDVIMDFSKVQTNKFVLFRFQDWKEEHPHGLLVQTLGDIDHLPAFYEYQLYSKSLNSSLKEMTQKVKEMTKKKTVDEYFDEIQANPKNKVEDWSANPTQIFTIDPANASDFDDGLSIQPNDTEDASCYKVTVYITNVVFWLDLFQLWDSFDNRVATIYLPDKRRPMLPTILTDTLCSLKEGSKRFAIAIKFTVQDNVIVLDKTTIHSVLIRPYKNYVYEDPALIYQDKNYIQLFNLTSKLDGKVRTSRDLVTYWMITANSYAAKLLLQAKTGIFRIAKLTKSMTREENERYKLLDEETRNFLEYHAKAESVLFNEGMELSHDLLKVAYTRISSVMRRYEDVLNMEFLMLTEDFKEDGKDRKEGMCRNQTSIHEMNVKYENIRRIESVSGIINECKLKGELIKDGVIYAKEISKDGMYKYKVYVKGYGIYKCKSRSESELYERVCIRVSLQGVECKVEII
jgi:RNB domain